MQTNELIETLIPIIKAGLTALEIEDVPVKAAFQPTNQGLPAAPTTELTKGVFIHALDPKRYGWMKRTDRWVQNTPPVESYMEHKEVQKMESIVQISTLWEQTPKDPQPMTAVDLANYVAHILQGDAGLAALREAGLGILRITDIRNPYIMDDKNRFQANPSFDFTITHEQVILTRSGVVVAYEHEIHRV